MHEVLVNRLRGPRLPRKSVVRLTDRPDMTLDVYRGRKTTMQQSSPRVLTRMWGPQFTHSPIGTLYTFSKILFLNVHCNHTGKFDVFCPSLISIDSVTDSENVSLIWLSVPDDKKTCSSKGLSLISI